MIIDLFLIWLGGVIAVAPEAYEDWRDKLLDWDEAIMAAYLWPVMLVIWAWKEWRDRG